MDELHLPRRKSAGTFFCRKYGSPKRLLAVAALCSLTATWAGCGKGGGTWQKVIVEGAATLDGNKVVNGDIRFIPSVASMGPMVGAEIIDGRFRVTNKGGVPVGTHRVMLRAFNIEGIGPATSELGGGDLFGSPQSTQSKLAKPSIPTFMVEGYAQFLPAAYNRKTALTIEISGKENPQIEDFNMSSTVP